MSDDLSPRPDDAGVDDDAKMALPANYPGHLARDVRSINGEVLHLRPIRPSDAHLLVTFHNALSPDSIYRRYFSLKPELSDAEVAHLTQVEYVDRFAFIVESDEGLVGVGRFDRVPGTTTAEAAFIVSDKYQHQGIGLMLLYNLADAARPLGITTFTAETQADNRSMMGVFEASGFPVTAHIEDEVITATFPIKETDQSIITRARRRLIAYGADEEPT